MPGIITSLITRSGGVSRIKASAASPSAAASTVQCRLSRPTTYVRMSALSSTTRTRCRCAGASSAADADAVAVAVAPREGCFAACGLPSAGTHCDASSTNGVAPASPLAGPAASAIRSFGR